MTAATHRPKGSMCAACVRKMADCSALPFDLMRPVSKDQDGTVVVLCEWFDRSAPSNRLEVANL